MRFYFKKGSETFEKLLEVSILRIYKGSVNISRLRIKSSIWRADHKLKMNLSRIGIRVLLLHEFRLGHKATEKTVNNICSTMGEDVLSIRTAQHWFNLFKNGNLELDDLPQPGRLLNVDVDLLKQLIK